MYRSAVALLALATPATGHASACDDPIPLRLDGPRPEVEMRFPNGTLRRVLFDTGAANTVVNIEEAESLGVVRVGPLSGPLADHGGGYQGRLSGARVGRSEIGPQPVPVMPVPLPIAAILSPYAFAGRRIELDFPAAEMRVCAKDAGMEAGGELSGYDKGPFAVPTIKVTIGDQSFDAHLDTGSPINLILPLSLAPKLELQEAMVKAGEARTHWGSKPIYRARLKGVVKVGPLTLTDPEVRFSDIVSRANVGTLLLRQMMITIDPSERKVWTKRR